MGTTTRWHDGPRLPGPAVVFDLDGVLADTSHRQHHLERRGGRAPGSEGWRRFFAAAGEDPVLPAARSILRLLRDDVTVILLSARPATSFDLTVEWLDRHEVPWHLLVLRGDGPVVPAATFKREVVRSLVAAGFSIEAAADDDPAVVTAYRAAGLPVLPVTAPRGGRGGG